FLTHIHYRLMPPQIMPNPTRTIMPEVYCAADAEWIQEQMGLLSPSMRQKIAVKYSEVYLEAWDREQVSYRQENRARHEANTRLRLFVGRYHKAAMGLTEKPPLTSAQAQIGTAARTAYGQQASDWR
ncbi:hypothetical protein, partial [Rahnella sp. ChDrAdgB13]|uniref:hypothetical protein n=1 Tax=Rahnella sp. ChDrAdgB13 TaxID=1850581 RepID=UPI0027DD3305